jgi:hypothetical protein
VLFKIIVQYCTVAKEIHINKFGLRLAMAIVYGIIISYLTKRTKSIDNGPYEREKVVQDLNTVLSPVLMPEMSYSVADQYCPEDKSLTNSQLECILNDVSKLVSNVVGGELIAQRMLAAATA